MIVNVNGYEIETLDKQVAAQGFIYIATKGGKKYFLKQYNPAKPIPPAEGGGSEKVYNKNLAFFEKRVKYRTRINKTIRGFSSSGGNIVAPIEEFVCSLPDESGRNLSFYWEATEFIPDVIPNDDLEKFIKTLDAKQKLLVMATAAGALHTIHQHGIVHSDLKLGNVLLAKNSSGKVVTKLIDFDGSYFLDDKDTLIAGDEVYCSPELLQFYSEEEDDSELRDKLNEKSDIFSLGIIYHFYLSGHLPVGIDLPDFLQKQKDKGKPIYCSEVLLYGGKLEISDKILSLNHRLLLQDMLQLDPAKRPTALQVLTRLKEPEIEFSVEEPWAEHSMVFKVDQIRSANYIVLRKINVDGVKQYELIAKNGTASVMTKDELISKGLAKPNRENIFDAPWPEHNIVFDIELIKKKKFVSLERTLIKTTKGYTLYRVDSSSQFFRLDNMIMFGFAREKSDNVATAEASEPIKDGFDVSECWPGYTFNTEYLMSHGFVSAEKVEIKGKKGYNFYTADGQKRFVVLATAVMMEFVIPK